MNTPEIPSKSLVERSAILRFGRLFTWRTMRRVILSGVGLVTLVALFYAEENWRGHRAWEEFKGEWEARGERFELSAFIPKPVPAEQNFATTPFFAALEYTREGGGVKWRDTNALKRSWSLGFSAKGRTEPSAGSVLQGEAIDLKEWKAFFLQNTNYPPVTQSQPPAEAVLTALSKFDPIVAELREASRRPYAIFPLHYEENFGALLPYLAALKSAAMIVRLRTAALLESGRTDDALKDVELNFALANAPKSDPILISQLVRMSILKMALQSVWEGSIRHRWQDHHLQRLEKLSAAEDVLADYGRGMRGERAFSNELLDKIRRGGISAPDVSAWVSADMAAPSLEQFVIWAPRGWIYQNQVVLDRLYQERALPLVAPSKHRVYLRGSGSTGDESEEFKARGLADEAPDIGTTRRFSIIARLLFPGISNVADKFALNQTLLDLATIACALERARLAQGQYPDTLDILVPRFLDKLPIDVINGEPLKYRRTENGQFLLYSIGYNQRDDGGKIVLNKSGKAVTYREGDWVWPAQAQDKR